MWSNTDKYSELWDVRLGDSDGDMGITFSVTTTWHYSSKTPKPHGGYPPVERTPLVWDFPSVLSLFPNSSLQSNITNEPGLSPAFI